jgi:hypothetical protein
MQAANRLNFSALMSLSCSIAAACNRLFVYRLCSPPDGPRHWRASRACAWWTTAIRANFASKLVEPQPRQPPWLRTGAECYIPNSLIGVFPDRPAVTDVVCVQPASSPQRNQMGLHGPGRTENLADGQSDCARRISTQHDIHLHARRHSSTRRHREDCFVVCFAQPNAKLPR